MPSRRRRALVVTALVAIPSCGSPAPPTTPSGGASPRCEAPAERGPGELSLLAWDATQRAEVRRLLGFGVVAVRYEQAGCSVSLELLPDCVGGVEYQYTPYYAEDVVLVSSPQQAVAKLPLGAESLRRDLGPERAVRIDTVLAGQYALAPGQRVDGWDRPECERTTHYARSIYVGGFARTSGERELLESAPSPFGMGAKSGHPRDTIPWRTDGSPEACKKAEEQGGEYALCSSPLRLELVKIPAQGAGASAPAPAPACPSGMASVPGGTFMMGSESGEADEKPVHSVHVEGFCMDVTEVTVDAYTQCVQAGACKVARGARGLCNYGQAEKGNHPMNCVDWQQAADYCVWQDKKLPTEEQWEYAARGGREGRRYPWDSAEPSASSACWNRWERRSTCEVGSYPAGAFGLKDMAGNVWEWTDTYYCDSYAESKTCTEGRASRGGAWSDNIPSAVGTTNRNWFGVSQLSDIYGFRCAR